MKNKELSKLCTQLFKYWQNNIGCVSIPEYYGPIGAATFHPFLINGIISGSNIKICYKQKCLRSADFIKTPLKRQNYYQFQAILPYTIRISIKNIFIESLEFIGFNKKDLLYVDFLESAWESLSLGAFGKGWEVRMHGIEICQITIFDTFLRKTLRDTEKVEDKYKKIIEFAYGLERIFIVKTHKTPFVEEGNPITENKNITNFDTKRAIVDLKLLIDSIDIYSFYMPNIAYEKFIQANYIFNLLNSYGIFNNTSINFFMTKLSNSIEKIRMGIEKQKI